MPALLRHATTNIYRLRAQSNLTQEGFAAKFSISKGHVCKLENGQARPSLDLLDRIAQEYKVEPSWIIKPLDRRCRL